MGKLLSRQRLGRWGEAVAARYLEGHGYRILDRNYRTPHGEIDLIAEKEGVRIFVEVKTRSGTEYGLPEEAVTARKREHLLAAIAYYWQGQTEESGWQVDVIAILRRTGEEAVELEHFENAIQ